MSPGLPEQPQLMMLHQLERDRRLVWPEKGAIGVVAIAGHLMLQVILAALVAAVDNQEFVVQLHWTFRDILDFFVESEQLHTGLSRIVSIRCA